MSETDEASSRTEVSENTTGVVLGYWDHEKTPTLIQDLEQSVNLVELKCKNLLKELAHYKKYLEKPGEIDFHLAVFKKKTKKSKNSVLISGSVPEIAFRKNCTTFQKIKQVFEKNFQEKLRNINKELQEAARKIGLHDSIILFPADFLKNSLKQLERSNEDEKEEEDSDDDHDDDKNNNIREKFVKLSNLKAEAKSKSDSVINDNYEDPDFSKITKNQLELYQNLSRLSMKKSDKAIMRKSKMKRKKLKFFVTSSSLKYRRGFRTCRDESKKSKPGIKALKKRNNKIAVRLKKISRSPRDSDSTVCSKDSKIIHSPVHTALKSFDEGIGKGHEIGNSPTLGAALRKVMPFTVCTSTSRSYNIGLNMQQLLSLPKYGRKADVRISASEKMHGDSRRTNIEGLNSTSSTAEVKKRHRTPWTHSQTKNNTFENGCNGNTWVSEVVTSSNSCKAQTKTTGRPPNSVFKYHKSTTSQFPNGQKMIQSESKTAYAVGSKIVVSDCHRTDIFEMGKNNFFKNAAGDGKCDNKYAELTMEWSKVYSSFLKIYRKYTCIKEKVADSDFTNTNEQLKSLEKDIDYSIEKYKEFLQFYTKFLYLNYRLKSLKFECETKTFEPVTSFSWNCEKKRLGYKPTHSMAMKDAFREVQALQAKINLIKDK